MENLPAWLQAFAALIALGISVFAVYRSGAVERQRAELEVTGMAVAIYPEIGMLKVTAKGVRNKLATLREQFTGQSGQSVAAHVQAASAIEIPPMLDRNTDRLFLLGRIAGPSCLSLVRTILIYNSLVDAITSRMALLNHEEWIEALSHIEKHLVLLDAIIAKCEREVRPLHDAVES